MGNSVRKLTQCCSCNGETHEIMMMKSHVMPCPSSDDFVGHSFRYVRPDLARLSSSENHYSIDSSSSSTTTTTFRSISGASVSANLTTVPLAASSSPIPDYSSTFKSSELVASLNLQPVPRGNDNNSHCWSGPIIKFHKSLSNDIFNKSKKKGSFFNKMLKSFVSDEDIPNSKGSTLSVDHDHGVGVGDGQTDDHDHDVDDNDDADGYRFPMKSQNLQWAQGKAGEDRTHLVVSEDEGWIFVGIYDGFSGPDAPDHLLANLFNDVFDELKGLLWNSDCDSETIESSFEHYDVLKAISEGLIKTEESYLKMADLRPELHAMGSCVLVMLMNGEDVYLMNVGDSRAILAQKTGPFSLIPLQLTMDHNTDVEEEVDRIKKEHPDDDEAIVNERVKGYLKVTRAFGVGFLKQPKWNDALCEILRIYYVGTSPYITSSPSLYHYKLSPDDRFLILSSDGLYQYFTNQQVVSETVSFMASFPDGDPAQHLVEEVLIRAAEKAGLEFHELVDIPSGERRMYHDDVSVIIISLEGRIWRSSMNRL